jgi:hypothetical protein
MLKFSLRRQPEKKFWRSQKILWYKMAGEKFSRSPRNNSWPVNYLTKQKAMLPLCNKVFPKAEKYFSIRKKVLRKIIFLKSF